MFFFLLWLPRISPTAVWLGCLCLYYQVWDTLTKAVLKQLLDRFTVTLW